MKHYFHIVVLAFCFTSLHAISTKACIADFGVDVDFKDKSGNDVVLYISEGISQQKSSIYYYKNDFDGSIKMVTIALAAKNLDDQQLQSLKKHVRDSLTAFIKYWDSSKLKKKTRKSTKEAVVSARKLLADLKDNKLSEDHIEYLLFDIVARIDQETAGGKRKNEFVVYDEDGNLPDKGTIASISSRTLNGQLPSGLYASAMNREVNRGGDIFGKNEGVCGDRTYAGSVLFKAQSPKVSKADIVPPPSSQRTDQYSQGMVD